MKDDFIESLASPAQPIPGGGAAAAHVACVGAALLEKIAGVELNRAGAADSPRKTYWSSLVLQVSHRRSLLGRLRDRDGDVYLQWAAQRAADPSSPSARKLLLEAVNCPLEIMEAAAELLNMLPPAMEHCRKHLLSDLLAVRELLEGAIRGAAHIVCANLRHIPSSPDKDKLFRRLESAEKQGCNAREI